jgi:hypothetical protein
MPHFQVLSTDEANNELAGIWQNANSAERARISQASDYIDEFLREDAEEKGSPYHLSQPEFRFLANGPLTVYFHVSEQDRTVLIFKYQLSRDIVFRGNGHPQP